MSALLDLALLGTSWIHVLLAPYTKVEESFNLHATHDVLMYGVQPAALENYDHFVFPGAVPRTFIGSVLLAWLSTPAIRAADALELVHDKADLQLIVRLVLATCNAIAFCLIRRAVSRRFGGLTSLLFVILTCTQFHLPFWMGRTLPNMFALIPVNLSLYLWNNRTPHTTRPWPSSVKQVLALLAFTAAVFRSEVLLLLGPLALQTLICGYVSVFGLVKIGVVYGLGSAALTTLVDSYFWQRWPLWPELYGIYFNVLEGKSAEWGVLPYHTYFSSFLPKLLLSSLPLSVLGFLANSHVRGLVVQVVIFIVLISGLGHKEWRFVIYVIPVFNIAAACGAAWLVSRRKSTIFGKLCLLAVIGLLAFNCLATYLLTITSMANYPGGEALAAFNEIASNHDDVHVHISNLAAQTGASLFLQTHAPPYFPGLSIEPPTHVWMYNKTEHLSPQLLSASREITHIIAEADSAALYGPEWTPIGSILGFDRWQFRPGVKDALRGSLMDRFER
ncbi:glycosyltransferase family 22 protein [Wolfiporia cocos MD-104 SS10]|uniref:Mannosyltransferase n=1 Tax=Wolfiporia cocos (strain MD-104) TaxID=742152 RepID=A0A2H3JIX6_WOLCO|nr:glycosyltransferase family 22 protein [Wolfiporia cocos MD-104 SS10]